MKDPYEQLGVRRRINAAGALTRLGGAVMAPEVVEAMAAASRGSVDIGELQDAALDAAPGGGLGMGAVCGGHHDQLFGPVGEQFGEGQADHAAVRAADEGGDPLDPQMVQHQGQQARLVVGGDGDDEQLMVTMIC